MTGFSPTPTRLITRTYTISPFYPREKPLAAMDWLVTGFPFLLMRPPGHHAGNFLGVGGFCYFNNIAVAVKKALAKYDRAAILDIDVHHGNGTRGDFSGKRQSDFLFTAPKPTFSRER